jgi:hypothetical protein
VVDDASPSVVKHGRGGFFPFISMVRNWYHGKQGKIFALMEILQENEEH